MINWTQKSRDRAWLAYRAFLTLVAISLIINVLTGDMRSTVMNVLTMITLSPFYYPLKKKLRPSSDYTEV